MSREGSSLTKGRFVPSDVLKPLPLIVRQTLRRCSLRLGFLLHHSHLHPRPPGWCQHSAHGNGEGSRSATRATALDPPRSQQTLTPQDRTTAELPQRFPGLERWSDACDGQLHAHRHSRGAAAPVRVRLGGCLDLRTVEVLIVAVVVPDVEERLVRRVLTRRQMADHFAVYGVLCRIRDKAQTNAQTQRTVFRPKAKRRNPETETETQKRHKRSISAGGRAGREGRSHRCHRACTHGGLAGQGMLPRPALLLLLLLLLPSRQRLAEGAVRHAAHWSGYSALECGTRTGDAPLICQCSWSTRYAQRAARMASVGRSTTSPAGTRNPVRLSCIPSASRKGLRHLSRERTSAVEMFDRPYHVVGGDNPRLDGLGAAAAGRQQDASAAVQAGGRLERAAEPPTVVAVL